MSIGKLLYPYQCPNLRFSPNIQKFISHQAALDEYPVIERVNLRADCLTFNPVQGS